MTLIVDNTTKLNGQPGIHALIAGVSFYKHLPGGDPNATPAKEDLGLLQLDSTARSAHAVSQWLVTADQEKRLPLPLATLRMVLSPSPAETGLTAVDPCTWEDFAREAGAWRQSASHNPADMTFFYYSGHGVQLPPRRSIILMSDYGAPSGGGELDRAVDMQHVFDGMGPPADVGKTVARTQLYFVDACRSTVPQLPDLEWDSVRKIWRTPPVGADDRTFPIFFGAIPGAAANAIPEKQTLFSMALIDCLNRLGAVGPEGADARWRVTSHSLNDALEVAIRQLNKKYEHLGATQGFSPEGQSKRIVLAYLNEPPEVEIEFKIDPTQAVQFFGIEIFDRLNRPVKTITPVAPHPHRDRLRAGLYNFKARLLQPPHPTFTEYTELGNVTLPAAEWVAKVAP